MSSVIFTVTVLFIVVSTSLVSTATASHPLFGDESYIMWCPCMGRFGNQVDVFLGGLRLAKKLNRTLVVPPFIEYIGMRERRFPPFSDYFNMSYLGNYHRSVAMEDFFKHYGGDSSWTRTAFCSQSVHQSSSDEECEMRRGQPSTDFWDKFNVQFDESVRFTVWPLTQPEHFQELYPASRYPVVMLGTMPGHFPVLPHDRELQRHVVFRREILDEVAAELEQFPKPILSVHIRNGVDWQNACQHAMGETSFMESPQCLEESKEEEIIKDHMCFPNQTYTVARIRHVVIQTGARSVFIGTDNNAWVEELQEELLRNGHEHVIIKASPFVGDSAYIRDLVVFSTADYFLGNCISSFTGFATRYRRHVTHLATLFFGVDDDDVAIRGRSSDIMKEL